VSGCAGVVAGVVVLFHNRVDDVVAGAAYWAAGIWALTGGVILIGDALLLRRRLRDQERVPAPRQP
jgi:uncharacterized membrane protein HdeD (DUF308 family)